MWKKAFKYTVFTTIISLLICFIYYGFIYNYFVIPKLMLKGPKTETINLSEKYNEPGYEAKIGSNNAEDKVIVTNDLNPVKTGEYEIKYSIKNKKGRNEIIKKRKVIVVDIEKPTITLKDANVTIYKDSKYIEPGYTAIDGYDGDLTNKVLVTSTVDASKVGVYNINYKVQDSSGNEASIDRKVSVINRPLVVKASSSGIPILMYHFFYSKALGEKQKDSNYMEIGTFEEQMKYLKDNDYYFPTWDELEKYIDGTTSLPKKSVIITDDDGNESFFRLAYPILQKYNVKATSFLITSWVTPNSYGTFDRTLIDFESHSDNMHRGGCKTGAGGIFQCISHDAGYNDLMASIKIVGSSEVFCYPFGDYNDSEIALLKEAGFKMAVTIKGGKVPVGANKLLLPRVRVSSGMSLTSFINAIK